MTRKTLLFFLLATVNGCAAGNSMPTLPSPSAGPTLAPSIPTASLTMVAKPVETFANIIAPREGRRGQAIPVVLRMAASDSCNQPGETEAIVDESQRTVTFRSTVTYFLGQMCSPLMHYPKAGTYFTPQNVGVYKLRLRLQRDEQAGPYDHLMSPPPDLPAVEPFTAWEVDVRE